MPGVLTGAEKTRGVGVQLPRGARRVRGREGGRDRGREEETERSHARKVFILPFVLLLPLPPMPDHTRDPPVCLSPTSPRRTSRR